MLIIGILFSLIILYSFFVVVNSSNEIGRVILDNNSELDTKVNSPQMIATYNALFDKDSPEYRFSINNIKRNILIYYKKLWVVMFALQSIFIFTFITLKLVGAI